MAKHQSTEFVIAQNKTTLLKENVERVRSLFCVEVSLTLNPNNGIQWICLKGSTEELRETAKTYISSLCSTNPKHCLEVPAAVVETLKNGNGGKEIEKLTGAVLSFNDSKVFLQGDDLVVTMAISEIEQRIAAFEQQHGLDTSSTKFAGGDDVEHDAENIPENSTVDTTDIPPSMREFARKLHYQDKDIDAVVRTFGTEININQLLQELVKNSASSLQLSSASEDTNLLPLARGSCSPSLPTKETRILYRRGAGTRTIETRQRDFSEQADQHVKPFQVPDHLRPIVIDGSNVAMNHGNQRVFSCRGIKLCVEYFMRRGHDDITVFVPMWRREKPRPESPISEQEILNELSRQNVLKFTPSRWSGNRHIICYDDKYIVDLADQNGGIIVSNDNFRDLHKENPRWKETIEQRSLGYTFVGDRFMPPDDPLGRRGPSLDDFLRKGSATHPKICPYLKNCTFGNRCKYYHPERDTQRQQEKATVRTSPENPESSTTTSVESSAHTSTRTHHGNIVGDPRVSTQPQPVQSRLEPRCTVSPSTPTVRDPRISITTFQSQPRCTVSPSTPTVRDPRVSITTFQSQVEKGGRSHEIGVRGRGQATGAPYDHTRVPYGGEHYYPGYYEGNVYNDYLHPVASDYTARNLPYQEPPRIYHHDMGQFCPLPPAQWPPYPQHPYATPAGMGYPAGAGQCTYATGSYFEPPPAHYRYCQGGQRDQIDSSNSQDNSISKEKFDELVDMLKNVFEGDQETIIHVLRTHPKECADGDINKLAEILLEPAMRPN